MNLLEVFAVGFAFSGIWLTTKRLILCWPVNLIACALYFKLFYDVRLYADMVLQALFAIMIAYGWISWKRYQSFSAPITVDQLPMLSAVISLALGAVSAFCVGWLLRYYSDGSLPWLDASLTCFSLVAQYWTVRRYAESWLLWIIVDIIFVIMFMMKDLWLTAGLYAAMTILAFMGYQRWRSARVTAVQ